MRQRQRQQQRQWQRASRAVQAALAAVILLHTGGCAALPDLPSRDQGGSAAQEDWLNLETPDQAYDYAAARGLHSMMEILEDRVVTREEYERAFQKYMACREALGWTYQGVPTWNGLDRLNLNVIEHMPGVELTPELSHADSMCQREFDFINVWFQTNTKASTEAHVMAALEVCFSGANIQFAANATNLQEMLGRDAANRQDFDEILQCVNSTMETLYPGQSWVVRL